jgi:hypothetical protein
MQKRILPLEMKDLFFLGVFLTLALIFGLAAIQP